MQSKRTMAVVASVVLFSVLYFVLVMWWLGRLQREWMLVNAARRGDVGLMARLEREGVDARYARCYKGVSALEWAIVENQREATRYLLQRGADPNEGLSMAILFRRSELLGLLFAYGADATGPMPTNGMTPMQFERYLEVERQFQKDGKILEILEGAIKKQQQEKRGNMPTLASPR